MKHFISTHQRPPSLEAQLLELSAHPKYPPVPGGEGGSMTLASECFSKPVLSPPHVQSLFTPSQVILMTVLRRALLSAPGTEEKTKEDTCSH